MMSEQAWYARDVILGKIELPSREVMASEWKKWKEIDESKPVNAPPP